MAHASEPHRMLGLDASAVPILYRIVATDEDGNQIGEATAYLYENEVDKAKATATADLANLGHPNATVTYRPA